MGVDEFLGQVVIPLQDLDFDQEATLRPKTVWYPLKCKPGQKKSGFRGELEVKTGFVVSKEQQAQIGSVADVSSKKNKKKSLSVKSLTKAGGKIGGSLMVLGSGKDKSSKKKKDKDKSSSKLDLNHQRGSNASIGSAGIFQRVGSDRKNRDPGVESDEEENYDNKSLRSVTFDVTPSSNDNVTAKADDINDDLDKKEKNKLGIKLRSSYRNLLETGRTGSLFNLRQKDKEEKRHLSTRDLRSSDKFGGSGTIIQGQQVPFGSRVVLGKEITPHGSLVALTSGSRDSLSKGKEQELLDKINKLQEQVDSLVKRKVELEDYIDNLLSKVISDAPALLQKTPRVPRQYVYGQLMN
jgi:hypothetical protein